jgi:3-oxoacyl-[acyl-carrier protein] reductase
VTKLFDLSGKTAIVTGGGTGIGRQMAQGLAEAGADLVLCARKAERCEQAASELEQLGVRAIGLGCDVRDPEQVQHVVTKAVEELGGVDILVNNAGIGTFANVAEMSDEDWNRVLETNLTGVFYCCSAAIPQMRTRGGGWIINISSLAGKNAFVGGAAYCASKAGLNAFSEALMQEVRHDRIRVSYVMPGSVATEFSRGGSASGKDWKLASEDVAQVVMELLAHPDRSLPSRVELRPSMPPKK